MSRWKMNKLGFVNFWLYDMEEFPLENGHLLLRGSNGSGKSITTQSFISFILDGNKSPERLDPFGSRDRKMEYYLLGEDEREESTGYLYLELKKADAEVYLTLGIGMRAQRGKPIDFWGFCLNDGRRVGADGFQLYERTHRVLLPLSKQKLKNLLGNEENWADSPGKYKELVNARVFQFGDLRQYEQLISLLIKVRAPKLSKDFRPSAVKTILNDSLQVLTDEDLSAMVSTMERMDELEDTLRDLREAKKAVQVIRNEYTRYNQYVLGRKGDAYVRANQRALQMKKHLEDVQQTLASIGERLRRQEQARETSSQALSRALAERAAMGDDDLSAKQRELEELRGTCETHRTNLRSGEEQLRRAQDALDAQEIRLRERRQAVRDAGEEIASGLRGLAEINRILELGDAHEAYARDLRAEPLREALRRRREQIRRVLSSLEQVNKRTAEYDEACQRLDAALTATAQVSVVLGDAQRMEQEERDRLLEAFVRRAAQNELLRLEEAELRAAEGAISRYHSPADWGGIQTVLDGCRAAVYSRLTEDKIRTDHALELLRAEKAELERELNDARSQPDPKPPRREQIELTRIQLALQGIPCVPFYEAVDFAPELPQPERDLLEAQLSDAGLLDALLVPEEHLPAVRELLSVYPDRFLRPAPPAEQPLTALVPEAGRYAELAGACLRGISRADLDEETALLPDGRFRSGMVRGRSHAEQQAGFVGAAARRANRARRIADLERRVAALSEEIAGKESALEALSQALARLKAEYDGMPTGAELDHALDLLAGARQDLERTQAEQERCHEKERGAKAALARAEQECRARSVGLPYARTLEAYEEAKGAAEDYREALGELRQAQTRLDYARQTERETAEQIDRDRDSADLLRRRIRSDRALLGDAQARAQGIEQYLNSPENRERARRIAELEREIAAQRDRQRDAEIECATLRKDRESAAAEIEGTQARYAEAVMDEDDLEKYFREELALELLEATGEGESLLQTARSAAGRIPPADRERTLPEMENSLRKNYEEHRGPLLQYQPRNEPVFDAPAKPAMLRQRLCITFQKEGKELPLPAFVRELQTDIETTAAILEAKDRDLFENILTETISHKLRRRVEESQKWTRDMTELMQTLNTSMGLTFILEWRPKRAEESGELDTAQLVQLLSKDRALLTREDSQRVSAHFRTRVRREREQASANDLPMNYADLIRSVLDYRTWYAFRLFYRRGAEPKKELTDRVFNRFSGGEKAMSIYVPLFAAVSAQYLKGGEACPRLLALDEAFAGVDERNIGAMFSLVGWLDFDYIMNSQVLWGCYPNVADLDIAELHHPVGSAAVAILRYHWNGTRRQAAEVLP